MPTTTGNAAWKFIPAAMEVDGFGWTFGLGLEQPNPVERGLMPGQSATFAIKSRNSPGAMSVYLEGDSPIPSFDDEPPACVSELLAKYLVHPLATVKLVTMGPTGPVQ